MKTAPTKERTSQSNGTAMHAQQKVVITPPKIETVKFHLEGTAPLVQLKFTEKAKATLVGKFQAEPTNKKKVHDKRDFDEEFKQAVHTSTEGWIGVHAGAFRAGLISACRLANYKMTIAKLSVFIVSDGIDNSTGEPLVKLQGKPEKLLMVVRNSGFGNPPDLRMRAKFWPWKIDLKVSFDAGQFSATDVTNLLSRVGQQIGIGEGRPDSTNSAGMGWGTFDIK